MRSCASSRNFSCARRVWARWRPCENEKEWERENRPLRAGRAVEGKKGKKEEDSQERCPGANGATGDVTSGQNGKLPATAGERELRRVGTHHVHRRAEQRDWDH